MKNIETKKDHSYKVIFFGSESAGLRCLKFLIKQNNIKISFLITNEKGISNNAFFKIARENNICIISKVELLEKINQSIIIRNQIDFILSVFSPFIVDDLILNHTKYGGYNLHPGKLPEYAGLNPTSWSIYNNEKYHEVTLHKMNSIIDGGDIVDIKRIEIMQQETAISLLIKSTNEGLDLIKDFIKFLSQDNIENISTKKQDLKKRKYYTNTNPLSQPIDWNESLNKIDRIFRSSYFGIKRSPWGFPKTLVNDQIVELKNYKFFKCQQNESIGKVLYITGNLIEIAFKNGIIKAEIVNGDNIIE